MNQQDLIKSLNHPDARARLQVAQVLHMLDETAALPALAERFAAETEPEVRNAIAAAGHHLRELAKTGYTTVNAIFKYFKVDEEIAHLDDPDEAELLKQVQDATQIQLIKEKQRAQQSRAMTQAGLLAGSVLLGGASGAMIAASAMMSTPADVLSSNLGTGQPAQRRGLPTAPASPDITIQARRLREDPDPERRRRAAIDLGSMNNTAALPHLAAAFLTDSSAEVRAAAQRSGKLIYWNAVYWQMTQDGSFDAEYQRRAALRPAHPTPATPAAEASAAATNAPSARPDEDVGEILRRAQERRQKRERR